MTIQQVIEALQSERQNNLPSRYPCRAIMVKNVKQYCELLSELKKISDIRIVESREIFSSPDTLPKYDLLKSPIFQNQWVILTGVSEYLRLFSKKESTDRRFASLWGYQAPASSTGRIIIPLWGCEAQWFDPALNLNGDLRQNDFFYDCIDSNAPEQTLSLLVLSDTFEKYFTQLKSMRRSMCIGLQEWFEYWENPSPSNTDFALMSKRYNSITTTNGDISVHVLKDILSFIKEHMPGADILTSKNCSEDMQNMLFSYALKGTALDNSILNILNVSTFSEIDVMGKWVSLNQGQKALVALWVQNHPSNSYLNHCFNITPDISDIVSSILHEIFQFRNDKAIWVREYKALVQAMSLTPDQEFFAAVDKISEYETRLDFVTSKTKEERIYLIRMVGEWARKDPAQVRTSQKLKSVYPQLAAYLDQNLNVLNTDIGAYMTSYKMYKLSNTLPEDEDLYFNGVETDSFESRYSVISEYVNDSTVVFWVDALGVEWLPLLYWTLTNNCDGTIQKVAITQATLPTETCYNAQWKNMDVPHEKRDKLDKLAHKGVIDDPDYYACIEEQLTFVSELSNHVSQFMNKYHRVIITGDHGTSRLAARFFHAREGISAPMDAVIGSHGRFCQLPSTNTSSIPVSNTVTRNNSDGTSYIVFRNYDHFKRSGFAAGGDDDNALFGEVHGGAAPEEMLVPVVVIDNNRELPLTAKWENSTSKIFMRKAKFTLTFNQAISQLVVKIGNELADVVPNADGMNWHITFSHVKKGTYAVSVFADNKIIFVPDVTVQSALDGGEGDLP